MSTQLQVQISNNTTYSEIKLCDLYPKALFVEAEWGFLAQLHLRAAWNSNSKTPATQQHTEQLSDSNVVLYATSLSDFFNPVLKKQVNLKLH